MKTLVSSLMVALALAASAAHSQEPAPNGKALYREKCVMCHDKTGMGTGILSRRVKVAELLLRVVGDADGRCLAVDPNPFVVLGEIETHAEAPLRW
jgi:hypothetical protein